MDRSQSTDLEVALRDRLPATLGFLRELVSLNSFTANAAGVTANAERIIQQFAPFGWTVRSIPCALPGTGSHLVLDSGGDGPVIGLVSHLDTVFPPEEEVLHNFRWQPEGNRIYGPGIADIKGGTALMWLMLDALAKTRPEMFGATRWVLLWNAAEERLAEDFEDFCLKSLPRDTRACLIFEPGDMENQAFNLIGARKGSCGFHIRVLGRAAHSGGSYAQGASAIHQLARVIDRVMALTDLRRGTTVNVGTVHGGTVNNRVPHEAEATLEVRASDAEHFAQVRGEILRMAGPGDVTAHADGFACQIEVTGLREVAPWPRNPRTDQLLDVWTQAAGALGYDVTEGSRGGLSDGNRLWRHFPTLDALGPSGDNLHASERSEDGSKLPEFLLPASILPKALLNCLALEKLLSGS